MVPTYSLSTAVSGHFALFWRATISYSTPDRGAEYCDERVCLCVRLSAINLRNYTSDLRQIFVHVTYGCGSVLLGVTYLRFYG